MTDLAREYGEGLYILARDEDIRAQIGEELRAVTEIMRQQPDFLRLLASRAVSLEERLGIVDAAFGHQAHPYLVNFMKILIRRGCIDAFYDCAKWFSDRYNEDFGIVEAHVTTAAALPEDRLDALRARLEEIAGKKVVLITAVDPSLLGGVRVEMNGKKFDNSIKNRLERLKFNLTKA